MPLAAVDTDVVMTSVQKRRGPLTAVRRVPVWCVGAFAAAAFAIVWWSSSIGLYHGPDHAIGPFRLPVAVEWALGGAAVASAVAGCTWMILRRSDRSPAGASLSPITSLWLVCAAALSAGCWRVLNSRRRRSEHRWRIGRLSRPVRSRVDAPMRGVRRAQITRRGSPPVSRLDGGHLVYRARCLDRSLSRPPWRDPKRTYLSSRTADHVIMAARAAPDWM